VPESAVVEPAMLGFCAEEVKAFGPLHAYVAPVTVAVERLIVAPVQYGPPLEAAGVAGVALTKTFVVPAAEVQPLTVMVTEYVPAAAVVELAIVGLCALDVKPFGPLQEYVAPPTSGVERLIVLPEQYGPPLLAVGVEGIGLTTTLVLPAAEVQPLTVTVTEYVPASVVVAPAFVGFWSEEVKAFGPDHAYVAPATSGVEREIVAPAQ